MSQKKQEWWQDAIFYHIYPLGFCGALTRNDFRSRVDKIGRAHV